MALVCLTPLIDERNTLDPNALLAPFSTADGVLIERYSKDGIPERWYDIYSPDLVRDFQREVAMLFGENAGRVHPGIVGGISAQINRYHDRLLAWFEQNTSLGRETKI